MKTIKLILISIITLISGYCYAGDVNVKLNITPNYNKKANLASIIILDKAYPVNLDQNGSGSVSIPLKENTFAQLEYGKTSLDIYLLRSKDIEMTLDPADWRGDNMIIECDDKGVNKAIRYFAKKASKGAISCEFTLKEEAYLDKVKKVLNNQYLEIDKAELPKKIKAMLKASARFEMIYWIYKYPRFHRFGERLSKADFESFTKFNQYIFDSYEENSDYLKLTSYKLFIFNWVYELMQLRLHGESYIMKKEEACNYIMKHTKDKLVREYLLSSTIYSYVKQEGIVGADKIIECFRANVTNPLYTVPFDREYNKWKKVLPGTKAFDFDYVDINGKRVKLSDFKGKNVFIDIWATWCNPCCYEIPFVKEMEHKYKDRNIVFISLSTDKDQNAWKKMVKSDSLGGIQLNFENNRDFLNYFNISAIPRFLVIDKEGNIVESSAPKPSSGELSKILDRLKD